MAAAVSLQKAMHAFKIGDYQSSAREIRKAFDADPEFLQSEAEQFVRSFPATERSQFWNAPGGLFGNTADLKSTFELIYSKGIWGGGSGAGSDLCNTIVYVAYVQHLMKRFSVQSIVDIGCGDWRFSKYLDFRECQYLGIDVVAQVIENNRRFYEQQNIKFKLADATCFDTPNCDLLLCKDVLQHISNRNVQSILTRARVARVALFTNDYHPSNPDCANGNTRPIDITAPPFAFKAKARLAFLGKVTFLAFNEQEGSP